MYKNTEKNRYSFYKVNDISFKKIHEKNICIKKLLCDRLVEFYFLL